MNETIETREQAENENWDSRIWLLPSLCGGVVKKWYMTRMAGKGKGFFHNMDTHLQVRLYSPRCETYYFIRGDHWAKRMADNTFDWADISTIEEAIDAGCKIQVLHHLRSFEVWASWKTFLQEILAGSPCSQSNVAIT